MLDSTDLSDFDTLRPRLRALLELHRTAESDEARATLVDLMEDVFLAAAWHVAQDLVQNGYAPRVAPRAPRRSRVRLQVVGGTDAA